MSDQNVLNPQDDPEVNSEFARGKALAREKGVLPGIDPNTGEIGAVTFRLLYNLMDGDAKAAETKFREIARKGGYGDVEIYQTLDIKGIAGAQDDLRALINRGIDLEGQPLDLFGRRAIEQKIQFHDNVQNEVKEALRAIERG